VGNTVLFVGRSNGFEGFEPLSGKYTLLWVCPWIRIDLIEGEVQTSQLIESSEGGVDVHGWHSRFPIHGNESGISEHCDYANSFGSTRAVPT
jgi:hypothetical protein